MKTVSGSWLNSPAARHPLRIAKRPPHRHLKAELLSPHSNQAVQVMGANVPSDLAPGQAQRRLHLVETENNAILASANKQDKGQPSLPFNLMDNGNTVISDPSGCPITFLRTLGRGLLNRLVPHQPQSSPSIPKPLARLDAGPNIDANYHAFLRQAFDQGFSKDFDLWMSTVLESIFYPLCAGLAEVSPVTTESIEAICNRFPYIPMEVPYINYDGDQHWLKPLGAISYAKNYDLAKDAAQNKKAMEDALAAAEAEVAQYYEQFPDLFNGAGEEVSKNYLKLSILQERLEHGIKFFDIYERDLKRYLPAEPALKERFARGLEAQLRASELKNTFPLSHRASMGMYTYAESVVQDTDFQGQNDIPYIFLLPIWLEDKTVLADLLQAANVMLTGLTRLKGMARSLVQSAPSMVTLETARGNDSRLEMTMLFTLAEGLLSAVQALNMAAGQIRREHNPNISDEALIITLLQNRIPSQVAKYLPAAFLGPATLNGHYIRELFVLNGDKIEFNSGYKQVGKKLKQDRRQLRANNSTDQESYDRYINKKNLFRIPIAQFSGLFCPVTRAHIEEGNTDRRNGIDVISQRLLHTFQSIRHLRAKGGLSIGS